MSDQAVIVVPHPSAAPAVHASFWGKILSAIDSGAHMLGDPAVMVLIPTELKPIAIGVVTIDKIVGAIMGAKSASSDSDGTAMIAGAVSAVAGAIGTAATARALVAPVASAPPAVAAPVVEPATATPAAPVAEAPAPSVLTPTLDANFNTHYAKGPTTDTADDVTAMLTQLQASGQWTLEQLANAAMQAYSRVGQTYTTDQYDDRNYTDGGGGFNTLNPSTFIGGVPAGYAATPGTPQETAYEAFLVSLGFGRPGTSNTAPSVPPDVPPPPQPTSGVLRAGEIDELIAQRATDPAWQGQPLAWLRMQLGTVVDQPYTVRPDGVWVFTPGDGSSIELDLRNAAANNFPLS